MQALNKSFRELNEKLQVEKDQYECVKGMWQILQARAQVFLHYGIIASKRMQILCCTDYFLSQVNRECE